MAIPDRRYSCESAVETLEWMNAIADFLRPYKPLIDSHVVSFFKDRLWELVDDQWIECLRKESIENLLGIPSGLVQDYWPASLQEFILKLRSLALPREQRSFNEMLPNFNVAPIGTVLSQGMNSKKKHEVEILAAVINAIAQGIHAQTILDVGSGQGYLAQALSFEYQLSVIAIDASLHHSTVTSARAERIKKHYAAKFRKSGYGNRSPKVPQVVTCHVLSSDMLTTLSTSLYKDNSEQFDSLGSSISERKGSSSCGNCCKVASLVLAGLHACGDLSVSMLRTFVDCEQVKALVGIGCCYNLLSEESFDSGNIPSGFPMSAAPKLCRLNLGKNARDLACQSAERWRNLTNGAARENFELHTFRAAFQMVLDKYYPGTLMSSPSIGRQGKALRRQQLRRSIESQLGSGGSDISASKSKEDSPRKITPTTTNSSKVNLMGGHHSGTEGIFPSSFKDDICATSSEPEFHCNTELKEAQSFERRDKYVLFKEFCELGLNHLSLGNLQDIDVIEIWREAQQFSFVQFVLGCSSRKDYTHKRERTYLKEKKWKSFQEIVGPYWSLRAALGQLVETYILLDRLLFLQERGNLVEAHLFPIFDPNISPRNIAIIARKTGVCS